MVTALRERHNPWKSVAAMAMVTCALVLIGAPGSRGAETAKVSVHTQGKGPAIEQPVCGQMDPGNPHEEDLVAGIRLKSRNGRLVTAPHPTYFTLQDLSRSERSYGRSMRSINNSIREMRNNLNRIRTYRRLFR